MRPAHSLCISKEYIEEAGAQLCIMRSNSPPITYRARTGEKGKQIITKMVRVHFLVCSESQRITIKCGYLCFNSLWLFCIYLPALHFFFHSHALHRTSPISSEIISLHMCVRASTRTTFFTRISSLLSQQTRTHSLPFWRTRFTHITPPQERCRLSICCRKAASVARDRWRMGGGRQSFQYGR